MQRLPQFPRSGAELEGTTYPLKDWVRERAQPEQTLVIRKISIIPSDGVMEGEYPVQTYRLQGLRCSRRD